MSDNNNIKKISAADIEKYHKGLLSAKERHDLEKAALEDPFLADAIEGYAAVKTNIADDIAELHERLSEKTERGKVIVMQTNRTKTMWWKAAAVIILVGGAGLLVYQFGFNTKKETIAQNNSEPAPSIATDSSRAAAPTENKNDVANQSPEIKNEKPALKKDEKVTITKENFGAARMKLDTVSYAFNVPDKQSQIIVPKKEISSEQNDLAKSKDENASVAQTNNPNTIADTKSLAETVVVVKKPSDADGATDQSFKEQRSAFSNNNVSGLARNRNENFLRNNVFRGRVMDANNNPLPFANITVTQDSVGTYSDANGYFNLTSPDSVLNVQVQSLGYVNSTTALRNRNTNNNVVLKEDKSLNAIVLTNKKPNITRYQTPNAKVEEPEPADGWEKYDIYLANNLELSDLIRSKKPDGGDVEVSFDVDKNGDPTNIKIEKSLCSECDKEAVRLVKDGPKWKHKTKKKRATVRISF